MSSDTKRPRALHPSTLTRRQLLKGAAASGAALAVASVATPARADRGRRRRSVSGACSGLFPNEAYPLSPLVLRPFSEAMPIPRAARPVAPSVVAGWVNQPGPGVGRQDSDGGTHQAWPGNVSSAIPSLVSMPQPIVYRATMRIAEHAYSTSPVRTLVAYRNTAGSLIPAGTVVPRMPASTIYGFNGTFYGGVTINAEYGKPILFRVDNALDQNPRNLDRGDFGSPEFGFLCHLHNGHTAAESDGNPHHKPHGYLPGGWVDNLYLNYPAGGNDSEKMSFLWFHDHFHGHTGANVYKGMAGLYPIYDPGVDDGREATSTLHLPGVRTDNADGSFNVDYDLPIVLHDVALDDGNTPHQDFHNGCGEVHPHNWGKNYFRHFPNLGFVGDVFCVNGKAYPTLTVKRRKYRLRFLDASISRQWDVVLMRSPTNQLTAAIDMGFPVDADLPGELQGQWRLLDGQMCMRMLQIGNGGGLLPNAVLKGNVEIWPATRPQVVVDFTRYMDGTPTRKGDVVWLVNVAKMPDGRKLDSATRLGDLDPRYKVPILKIVIGDDAPDASAEHWSPNWTGARPQLRPQPFLSQAFLDTLQRRDFRLERGGGNNGGGENQWLINDLPFDPFVPMVTVRQGRPEIWAFDTGGGWSHPMHIHHEEFRILSREGGEEDGLHAQDFGKDDVIELDGGEEVVTYRNFRSFTGKYVAHCHNLAHEDHAMMFGWVIEPPPPA
jgi:FtsP/CotA-like multicopper oxidase with cupredoxin domain